MTADETRPPRRRVAIIGGGVSGLGAAWALNHHPDRFDIRLYEASEQIGGNAITVDMPQDDGTSIPFDISVTACIPSVYDHILLLMEQFGIELLDTRFSYSVKYGGRVYAHDFDSDIREQLQHEITYIMHNQQPWANRSDKPCLVTYNPTSPIDEQKIIKKWWFQHIVHDVRHMAVLVSLFRFIQGRRRTWHCGAHTLINSQETCFVTGLAAATQLGADYPFDDPAAKRSFNFYGSILYGSRFRKVSISGRAAEES